MASAHASYPTARPSPLYAEQDPRDWWRAACACVAQILSGGAVTAADIAAVGIDGMSWSCALIDEAGDVLMPAMIWMDRRSGDEARSLAETYGADRLLRKCGNPVDAAYVTPKLKWLVAHEPALYRRIHAVLQCNAYIAYRLTGALSQDVSQGYAFHFFDVASSTYDESLAEDMGIDPAILCPVVTPSSVVGQVTVAAARESGLKAGTPVVAGGLDAACCSLGGGVIFTGQTQEQGGQAGGMSILVDEPLLHPKLIISRHVADNGWLLQGGSVGGGSLGWFAREFGAAEGEEARAQGRGIFEVLSDEAGRIAPGAEGLLYMPYMAGERSPLWNSDARGLFFGMSYGKTRAHFVRAVMEGVGYSLEHNLRTAREVGAIVDVMYSVGGAANSRVWTQIKADITGTRICVPYSDQATTLGAAMLAGVGAGVYPDCAAAVAACVRIARVHEPSGAAHALYQEYMALYLELLERLCPVYGTLSALENKSAALCGHAAEA